MTKNLKIEVEEQEDGTYVAFFAKKPDIRASADDFAEAIEKVCGLGISYVAQGGDANDLVIIEAEEDENE